MNVMLLSNSVSDTFYNRVVLERALSKKKLPFTHVKYADCFTYKGQLYYGQQPVVKPDIVLLCNTIPLQTYEIDASNTSVRPLVEVYRMLRDWSAPSFNNITNHVLAANKQSMATLLESHGVSTPVTFPLPTGINQAIDLINSYLSYPVVIKTVDGYAANGIILIKSEQELVTFFKDHYSVSKKVYILQEYVSGAEGALHCVCVVGNEVKTTLRIGNPKQDPFMSDTMAGRVQLAIKTDDNVRDLAMAAMKALGLDYARLDIIRDKAGNLKVLEVNTPGGLNLTDVTFNYDTGMSIVELMIKKYS